MMGRWGARWPRAIAAQVVSGGQQRGGEVWGVQHMCVEEIATTGLGRQGVSRHALPWVVEAEVGLMVMFTAAGPAR